MRTWNRWQNLKPQWSQDRCWHTQRMKKFCLRIFFEKNCWLRPNANGEGGVLWKRQPSSNSHVHGSLPIVHAESKSQVTEKPHLNSWNCVRTFTQEKEKRVTEKKTTACCTPKEIPKIFVPAPKFFKNCHMYVPVSYTHLTLPTKA